MKRSLEHPIRKANPGTFQSDQEVIRQFVVRNRELDTVLEVLRGNMDAASCQHVLLVAPRGRGKTMLLARVAAELRTNTDLSRYLLPVRFMEESLEIFDVADFWLECLFYLARESAVGDPELTRELRETHSALAARGRGEELIEARARAAVLNAADRLGKQLVLMVENLQDLCGDVDEDFGWKLREALQSQPEIMLLATATSRFTMRHSRSSSCSAGSGRCDTAVLRAVPHLGARSVGYRGMPASMARCQRLVHRGAVMYEGTGRKRRYSAVERLYGIYYKLRRERDEAAIVRNLIHFMVVFYSKPELSEMSERLSDDVGFDWQAMRLRTTALLHQGDRDAVLEAFRAAYDAFRIGKRTMLREMLELVLGMIAFGVSERDLAEVLSSDRERADALAPLVVALRKRAGEPVRAPVEVIEVADDIIREIEAKMSAARV